MEKSTFSESYLKLLKLFREARIGAGLTQEEVAARIGQTQSFVSKCERGERRIDVAELYTFCIAFDISLIELVEKWEKQVKRSP